MKFNFFFFIYHIFYIYVKTKKITAITNSITESDNFDCKANEVIIYDKNSTYIRFFSVSTCANSCGKAFTDCSCHKTCETKRTCCSDYNRCTQIQTKKDVSNGQCKLTNLDNNDCVQCKDQYYLNNKDCVEKCPIGTEAVEQSKQCRPKTCIQENCDKCRGNICRKCYPGSFLFEGRCLGKCPMKLRADRKSWSCKRRTELSFYYVVPSNYDCSNQCGNPNNSDCSCDYTCLQKGNCCENFMSQCKSEVLKENCVLCNECDKEGKCVSCQANSELVSGQCRCSANYRHDFVNDACVLRSLNNNSTVKDFVNNVEVPVQIKNFTNPNSIDPIMSSVTEAPSANFTVPMQPIVANNPSSQASQSTAYNNNTPVLTNATIAIQSISPPSSSNTNAVLINAPSQASQSIAFNNTSMLTNATLATKSIQTTSSSNTNAVPLNTPSQASQSAAFNTTSLLTNATLATQSILPTSSSNTNVVPISLFSSSSNTNLLFNLAVKSIQSPSSSNTNIVPTHAPLQPSQYNAYNNSTSLLPNATIANQCIQPTSSNPNLVPIQASQPAAYNNTYLSTNATLAIQSIPPTSSSNPNLVLTLAIQSIKPTSSSNTNAVPLQASQSTTKYNNTFLLTNTTVATQSIQHTSSSNPNAAFINAPSQASQPTANNNASSGTYAAFAIQSLLPPLSGKSNAVPSNVDLSAQSNTGTAQSNSTSPSYPKSTALLPKNTNNQINAQCTHGTKSNNNVKKSGKNNMRNINILIGNNNADILNLQIKNKK